MSRELEMLVTFYHQSGQGGRLRFGVGVDLKKAFAVLIDKLAGPLAAEAGTSVVVVVREVEKA